MGNLLAGVDIGTSAVKVGLFDLSGRPVGIGRARYAIDSPYPGWAQCDPWLWWQGFLDALKQACDVAQVEPASIGAVGLSVLFPAVVPMDVQGHPLHPAILYNDRRSLAQVQKIELVIPRSEYQAAIGNRLMPGTCAVTSMAWLRDERPEAYTASHVLGFASTFMVARLTGEFCTDPTHAALSGLACIDEPWRWSEALCEKLGIELERLPRIVAPGQVVGGVVGAAARECGLRVGTPVVAGAGDVPASTIGAGIRPQGTAVYIAGSTDCLALMLPRPSPGSAWVNCAYVMPGRWLGIGTTTSSGVSVEWFAREFLGQDGAEGVARMTELAESAPPGSNRLLYLPYLQGERTPVWDPLARGVFIGLTASTARADLARAVFEGTAFALREVLEYRAPGAGPVEEIRAVGGGTRNELWNRIKAAVLKRPLQVLAFQDTSALGAALLAGTGSGIYSSPEEAALLAREVCGGRIVSPDPEWEALYDELFALYKQIYPRVQEIMHRLGEVKGLAQPPGLRANACAR